MFAWACWVYRFFLFLAIAVLVYTLFFKVLGVLLFIIEIAWFIVIPIYSELKQWWSRRTQIMARRRTQWLLACCLCALAVLLVPLQWTVKIPAVLEVSEQLALHAQGPGVIDAVRVAEGQAVLAGDVLFSIESPELENSVRLSQSRLRLVQARLDRTTVDAQDLEQITVLKRERMREKATLDGLYAQQQALQVTAPRDGVVVDLAEALHPGRWINDQLQLANLISVSGVRVRGYVSSEEVRRITAGAASTFVPDSIELDNIDGQILSIADTYAERISIPALTSRFEGDIAVSETTYDLEPLGAWYNVVVELDEGIAMPKWETRGVVHTDGEAESLVAVAWRQIMRVLVRESSV